MVAQIRRAFLHTSYHPFLFAFFPVLALYTTNIQELDLYVVWRPALVGLLMAGIVFLLFKWLTRNPITSGMLTSLGVILFSSYGHVFDFLRTQEGIFVTVVRNRYMVPAWLTLGVVAVFLVLRIDKGKAESVNLFSNFFSVFLIMIPLGNIAIHAIDQSTTTEAIRTYTLDIPKINSQASIKPDIYYIVLDSYPRTDVLKEEYGIDNTDFILQLEEIGFNIPPCSRSNYNYTLASLSSSLNMDYLNKLPVPYDTRKTNRLPMHELVLHNRLRETLATAGYKSVSIDHKYLFLEWQDADVFYRRQPDILFEPRFRSFERILLRTTLLRYWIDSQSDAINTWNRSHQLDPQLDKYDRLLFAYDRILEVPSITEPTLFFTNFDAIHPPLVFTSDGSYAGDSAFEDLTIDLATETVHKNLLPGAIEHLNGSLLHLVKTLIAESAVPPIIILQADHALAPLSRNQIFSAYYVQGRPLYLPDDMTPVNAFRLVLNEYFDASLPMLPNRAYYSEYGETPYQFGEVNDTNSSCK